VALVIGSGGLKCVAALGVWEALQRAGIEIELAVGCSGGSLYAASLALGFEAEHVKQMTVRFWTPEVMKGYASNLRASQTQAGRFDERSGLVDDSYMLQCLREAFGERTFEQARIPLHLVATDLYSGEQVVMSSGSLVDAIRASAAIPIIYPPWEWQGRLLIDGAASDPLPLDVAIREGAQFIIAVGFTLSYRSRLRSLTAMQEQMNSIYVNNILRSAYAFHNLAHHAEIIPMIPDFDRPISMFDTDQIPYLIEQGRQTAQEQMPYLLRLLESAPAPGP
jgi:NTE family protein